VVAAVGLEPTPEGNDGTSDDEKSENRDEAQFPEPDWFDVKRSPNEHVALGHGEHLCLGANLACLELIKHIPVRFTRPARPHDEAAT